MYYCTKNSGKMENQPICIVCAKSCVTAKDHTTSPNCSRSLHKTCSTSKIRDNPFENKNPVSSCLLCDSRIINHGLLNNSIWTGNENRARTSWGLSQQTNCADKSFLCFCVEVALLTTDIIIPKSFWKEGDFYKWNIYVKNINYSNGTITNLEP